MRHSTAEEYIKNRSRLNEDKRLLASDCMNFAIEHTVTNNGIAKQRAATAAEAAAAAAAAAELCMHRILTYSHCSDDTSISIVNIFTMVTIWSMCRRRFFI